MDVTLFHWISFNILILILLSIDLWRFYYHPHSMGIKEALWVTLGWISLAFAFNIWIYFRFGIEPALNFLTGYLLEKSLSIDNLFIFLLIFTHFKVPESSKHKVLFYGVLGAIVMRALLIVSGIALVENFKWVFPLFGIFLIITGMRLAIKHEDEQELENSYIFQWISRNIPCTPTYQGEAFFAHFNGKWMATPLLIVLILIEFTDLIFALDSVPAILGITTEPFIVYSSNIFAILGLRTLFFAIQGMMKNFHLLHYALAFILVFIGCKMLVSDFYHVPTYVTLILMACAFTIAIYCSHVWPLVKKEE